MSVTISDKAVEMLMTQRLTESQLTILDRLAQGQRVTWMAPITRRWLHARKLITFKSVSGKLVDCQITELGRVVLTMDRSLTAKGRK